MNLRDLATRYDKTATISLAARRLRFAAWSAGRGISDRIPHRRW
ncbi:hypothetical protein ACFYYN_18625 [Streptomyces sp. NPDC001902]